MEVTITSLEPVAGLLLDERNPRFEEQVDSQEAAITALLLDAPDKLLRLAGDIAEQGTLNPAELPIVVDEDGDLVVIEGNRRIAAIKLLQQPELARAASDRLKQDYVRKFAALRDLGIGPSSVEVYEADDRESARHWLELRHTGENDGIGIVEWKPWQANNYRRRRGSQADRATIFCGAVEVAEPE